MRSFLYAFTAQFLVITPAHAGDFECAWRQLPNHVRSALTDTPQTIQDVAAAMESGIITEDNLLPAMAACGVGEDEARTLGQYIAARALLDIQSRRLTSQFGLSEGQIAALVSAVSEDDRAAIIRWTEGDRSTSPAPMLERLALAAESQGIPRSNQLAVRAAFEYSFAQVVVQHLQAP